MTIAVNPLDPDNGIVATKDWRATPNEQNYLDTTTDGGATWQEQPFPRISPALPSDIDPAVAFRPDGRAYVMWTSFSDFQHGGLFTMWSDDGGFTWSAPVTVTPALGHYDDKPWLAFDTTSGPYNGRIYAAWTHAGNFEIQVAWSTDGGATWSAPTFASNGGSTINNDGAQPVILPDGSLVIVFLHDASPGQQGTLVLARSTDGGATFAPNNILFAIQQAPFVLPGEHWRQFTYHSLAYDPTRGGLTLVWPDYGNAAANGEDILTSRSTDQGATWSAATRLNDDPPGVVKDQWFPVVAAAPDGRLTALWLDRRDDPANRLYYAYARTSTDGGLSWGPGTRVSSVPSDPNLNIPTGSDGIGDYIGITAGPGVVWGAWVDVRNGNQDVYTARDRFTPQPQPTATPSPTPSTTATLPVTPTRTVTPTPTPVCADPFFTDVPASQPFYTYIQWLACRGTISGYTCGGPGEPCEPQSRPYFRPGLTITRGQILKLVVLAAGWPLVLPAAPTFADVPATHPFYAYIETGASHGVISGYQCGGPGEPCDPAQRPYFRSGTDITRAQLAKVIALARSYPLPAPTSPTFADVSSADPFYGYIEAVVAHGIVSGYTCGGPGEPCDPTRRPYFRPAAAANRAQAAKFVTLAFR